MTQGVVIRILHFLAHRIPCRKIEHHDIALLRTRPARQTLVLPMRFVQITLAATQPSGHRVLHQRHTERCLWHTCTVGHLAHVEKIAHTQTLLQTRTRYLVVLENIHVDEIHRHQRKHNCIYPAANGVQRRLRVLIFSPPAVIDILRRECIHYERQQHEPTQALPVAPGNPHHKRHIQRTPHTRANPSATRHFLYPIFQTIHCSILNFCFALSALSALSLSKVQIVQIVQCIFLPFTVHFSSIVLYTMYIIQNVQKVSDSLYIP